jgi:hypothetical protein
MEVLLLLLRLVDGHASSGVTRCVLSTNGCIVIVVIVQQRLTSG